MSDFAANFKAMLKRAGDKADLVVKKSIFQVWESIDLKSPVGDPDSWAHPENAPEGYTGGQFRANWNLSIGAPDLSTRATTDFSGVGGEVKAVTESYKTGNVLFLTNSLPYAARIEYEGWSHQAPQGVVRITALEFEDYVKKQAQANG